MDWVACPACGQRWPVPAAGNNVAPTVSPEWRCQRCLSADVARLLRQVAELSGPARPDY